MVFIKLLASPCPLQRRGAKKSEFSKSEVKVLSFGEDLDEAK
jgi:hypothetical protein